MLSIGLLDITTIKSTILHVLRDLVPFVQFKKREKHPWRSVICSTKISLLQGCFSRFLNCTNGTKLHRTSRVSVHFCRLQSKIVKRCKESSSVDKLYCLQILHHLVCYSFLVKCLPSRQLPVQS